MEVAAAGAAGLLPPQNNSAAEPQPQAQANSNAVSTGGPQAAFDQMVQMQLAMEASLTGSSLMSEESTKKFSRLLENQKKIDDAAENLKKNMRKQDRSSGLPGTEFTSNSGSPISGPSPAKPRGPAWAALPAGEDLTAAVTNGGLMNPYERAAKQLEQTQLEMLDNVRFGAEAQFLVATASGFTKGIGTLIKGQ
jgi:hypothetical protein